MNMSNVITLDSSDYVTLTPMEAEQVGGSRSPEAASPEDLLRVLFRQALAGEPAMLPNGASASLLRRALVLDPAISARIYNEAKAALAARQAPRTILFPAIRRARLLTGLGLAAIAMLVLAASLFTRPAAPIAELYASAATSPLAYASLLARARTGDARAQFALALLFDRRFTPNETTAPKNDALAFEWYGQAAAAGFAPAAQALGFAYLNGHGVARDPAAAAQWFVTAARAGMPVAQNSLGLMYQAGIGVLQDNAHAAQWFAQAAARGLPDAQNSLGAAYQFGYGVTQNDATAAGWYARAAAQGEPDAQNNLGFLYFNGLGVPRDTVKSAQLFAAAAQAGLPEAEVNFALSLASGAGVPKTPEAAAIWCFRARQAGARDAAAALAIITPQLSPEGLAMAQAVAK